MNYSAKRKNTAIFGWFTPGSREQALVCGVDKQVFVRGVDKSRVWAEMGEDAREPH